MYILTLYCLSNLWGQLCEHLCLFLILTAVERSDSIVHLTSSPLLSLRGSLLDTSPHPPFQDTPLQVLLPPSPHSTVSSKEKLKAVSVHSVEKKCSTPKTQSNQPVPYLPLMTPVGQTQACPSTTEVIAPCWYITLCSSHFHMWILW